MRAKGSQGQTERAVAEEEEEEAAGKFLTSEGPIAFLRRTVLSRIRW